MTPRTDRISKARSATRRATLALVLFPLPANANLILSRDSQFAGPIPQPLIFIGLAVVFALVTYLWVQHAASRRRRRELWFAAERQICS